MTAFSWNSEIHFYLYQMHVFLLIKLPNEIHTQNDILTQDPE